MPSSLSLGDLEKTKFDKIKTIKKDLKSISDYVIIDSSAGLGQEATSTIGMADELIIVTNPEMPAIADALKTIKLAEKMKKPVRGIIVTRVRKNMSEMQPETVKEMLETEVLGMVPEDLTVQEALGMKDAVVHTHPKSGVARAYKEIASKILDIEYDSDQDRESFWERMLKKFNIGNKI